ncbi:MAG: glycosyltransferase family 4 protein [Actinobacteria bacterium]|nr:glycosyltransferase family 4 protein [Actinomycetota bacterium]MCL6104603.1 glycosyltransferase family 4 protein [Actinomycetota bacterium]
MKPLRIAFLIYRGNPHCGGQGVYTRYLTRELAALGHHVEVFAGQPYPILEDGVGFSPVPSLDLYAEPNPFRVPSLGEFRNLTDITEFLTMSLGGFPEPLTFSLRARKILARRLGDFDIVHDNQGLGRGLAGIMNDGWPVIATIHHPITVDRELELAGATSWKRRIAIKRWYGFLGMQMKVASRLERIITVSESSRNDIVNHMGIKRERISVVPVGVDASCFRPLTEIPKIPGRIVTTASADVPMKGLCYLLEAVAEIKAYRQRSMQPTELVVVGKARERSRTAQTIARLGLGENVKFVSNLSDEDLVKLYAQTEVAVVPSLYEGFSLPAVEAMACGVPLVTTTGGAIPEVVGPYGETALSVPPRNSVALGKAIMEILDNPQLGKRLGSAGRFRVLNHFTWEVTARDTVRQYEKLLLRSAPDPMKQPIQQSIQ